MRMKALGKKFDKFLDHVFHEHNAKKEGANDFVPKEMAKLLVQLADDPNADTKLSHDSIKAFIKVIFYILLLFLTPFFFGSCLLKTL